MITLILPPTLLALIVILVLILNIYGQRKN